MSPRSSEKLRPFDWAVSLVLLILVAAFAWQWWNARQTNEALKQQNGALADRLSRTENLLASTTVIMQQNLAETQNSLRSALSQQAQNVQQQFGTVVQQVGNLSGTLTTLQKLSQTDPELLKKYSKVYFLNENYVPTSLTEIPDAYRYSSTKHLLFVTGALPHLEAMISAASSTGVIMYVDSAYRSFYEQKALKGDYTMTYGAGTANSFSADQGYSEHQLGTAVDLISPGQGGQLDGFDQTASYPWLQANAYKYGFILSYPKDNGYYVFEPWHWRYVGVKLATDLHNQGKNFYDMDQRALDAYLVDVFP